MATVLILATLRKAFARLLYAIADINPVRDLLSSPARGASGASGRMTNIGLLRTSCSFALPGRRPVPAKNPSPCPWSSHLVSYDPGSLPPFSGNSPLQEAGPPRLARVSSHSRNEMHGQ